MTATHEQVTKHRSDELSHTLEIKKMSPEKSFPVKSLITSDIVTINPSYKKRRVSIQRIATGTATRTSRKVKYGLPSGSGVLTFHPVTPLRVSMARSRISVLLFPVDCTRDIGHNLGTSGLVNYVHVNCLLSCGTGVFWKELRVRWDEPQSRY
jgi:hypothetical protein